MSPRLRSFLIWVPRLMGVALTLFLALFALDAFDGRPLTQALPDVLIHLAPAAVSALVVAAAWRYPWVGAVAFAALAIGYVAMVPHRLDWILVISGPLAVTAALFALSAAAGRGGPSVRTASPS
jgi:hypothetical protein